MRFQSGPGYCGAAAIVNALRCFGERIPENRVAAHAKTTVQGTDEHGIKACLEHFGYSYEDISEIKYVKAEKQLITHLSHPKPRPIIMLAESGNHWVTAVGMLGDSVIIFDSQNYAWNHAENGVHVIKAGKNLRGFWLPYENKRYAIVVKRNK